MWQRRSLATVLTIQQRYFHSALSLLRFDSLESLTTSVHSRIPQDVAQNEATYLATFQDLFDYASDSSSLEASSLEKLSRSLVVEPRMLSEDTFKKILLQRPPPTLLPPLLEAFQQRDPTKPISKDTGILALRHSLWDADIQNAVKIVDLTTASPQYLDLMRSKRNTSLLKTFVGLCGSVGGIDVVLRMFELSPRIGVYGMVLTYLGNLAFFGYLAFGGKFSGKLSDVQWKAGVSGNHKFIHADELVMFSKIAEADIELSNNDGFTSDGFQEALDKRDMEAIHPESDLLLQEYWLSGGDNFEWVEPNQDPAELQWRKHMETKKANLLKADVKWTDKFIPSPTATETTQ